MKKCIAALMGIVMIATSAILYSCNKETNTIGSEEIGTEIVQTKTDNGTTLSQGVAPIFLFRPTAFNNNIPCNLNYGHLCGYQIDAILSGDEVCWFELNQKDPDSWLRFYFPKNYLYINNAGELVDSARKGAVTFHADCEILDKSLMDIIGTDLLPAGRYQANVIPYHKDSVVCVNFGTTL